MSRPLRVGRVVHATRAEGPFLRTAIWVAGCSIRCPGCVNPHLFDSSSGQSVDPYELAEEIASNDVEGVTLIGGEPFDQPEACADLAAELHRRGLGVITFTGYAIEDLRARQDGSAQLLEATDLLVDGPFVRELAEQQRSLVGSTNQRFIHLTDRYVEFDPSRRRNRVEIRVEEDGSIQMAGFASAAHVNILKNGRRRRTGRPDSAAAPSALGRDRDTSQ